MVSETSLLAAAVASREDYDAVAAHVEQGDLTTQGWLVWSAIGDYYARDRRTTYVDKLILSASLQRAHPRHADVFRVLLDELPAESGGRNVMRELLAIKRDAVGDKLMGAIAAKVPAAELRPVIEAMASLTEAQELLDVNLPPLLDVTPENVLGKMEDGKRISFYPKYLNKRTRGGFLPGHVVLVFGRVNVGKSAIAIYNTAGWLRDGLRVLYIENEDIEAETAERIMCAVSGQTRDDARFHRATFIKRLYAAGWDAKRLCIPEPAPDTLAGIEAAVRGFKPDVVVVNQARNLAVGGKNANAAVVMDDVAKGLRRIAKRYKVGMMLVTAANEGQMDRQGNIIEKHELTMADCYSSRTGFPAAADVMIGVGSSKDLKAHDMLCLTLAKNKLDRDDFRPQYVKVDFTTGRIRVK